MQLILLVSFPNCVLFKQVLQQVFHHQIFYRSLSLSRVFLFESISRVHYISFTYGKIHRTFSLFIFVKATFLVSVSSVFIREKQAKGVRERVSGKERERGNSIAKQKMFLLGRQLLQEESSQWKSCCCCCSPSSYTFSTSPPPLLPPPPPPLCMSIKTKFK